MLNELHLVRNGLQRINPSILNTLHKDISEPPGNNVLRVLLKSDGSIDHVNLLAKGENKQYWCIGNNQNKFPCMKVSFVTRPGGVQEYSQWLEKNPKPTAKYKLEVLKQLRHTHPVEIDPEVCWPSNRKNVLGHEQIISNIEGSAAKQIKNLWDAYKNVPGNGTNLIRELDDAIWEKAKAEDKEYLSLSEILMFGGGKSTIPDGKRISILIDFEEFGIASSANRNWLTELSDAMYKNEKESSKKKANSGTCALSGKTNTELVSTTFPAPKCQMLGNVSIFNRKQGVPTFARYGKNAADSIPISKDLADQLASALRYLNEQEQNKTWGKVPSEKLERRGGKTVIAEDLMLAFCRDIQDVYFAGLLSSEPEDIEESDYAEYAGNICKSFEGHSRNLNQIPELDFLIIRKISDGVQKAVFSTSIPLNELENATKQWLNGCKNIPIDPSIDLRSTEKLKEEQYRKQAHAISPKEFTRLFFKNHTQALERKQKPVPGVAFSEVISVFISSQSDLRQLRRMLSRLCKQFSHLLEKAALNTRISVKGYDPLKHNRESLDAITAFCILLYKLDRPREIYMKDLAFKLGQYCAALDEIHIGYCVDQRKGQIPSSLLGNQAYAVALRNPLQMLDVMSKRIGVYKVWATTRIPPYKEGEELDKRLKSARSAGYWLQNTSANLHELISNQISKATPEYRAELMLGYLAGRPRSTKKISEQDSEQGENQ